MTTERAVDILSGAAPSSEQTRLEARLCLALAMIESYQIDIREWELDTKGFCQGSLYRRWSELLEVKTWYPPKEPS